jgi:hypothetical protein
MLFSVLYLILRRLLRTGRHPADEQDIELLILRHQLKVLSVPHGRFTSVCARAAHTAR